MYYDNKRSFYIKQYGPAVLILVLSVVLIGSGIFIYLSNAKPNTPPSETIVATDNLKDENKIVENNIVDNEQPKEDENKNSVLPTSLENLKILEKSGEVTVKSVSDNKVKIEVDNKNLEITLIGIDFANTVSNINDNMQQDLQGKKVKLGFDNQKYDDKQIYAYIYLDDILYNATLLENGMAKLKVENTNNSHNTELTQSQTFAKQTLAGVWAN